MSPKSDAKGDDPRDAAVASFEALDGLDKDQAEAIYDSGFMSIDDLASAMPEELEGIGIAKEIAHNILKQIGGKEPDSKPDDIKDEKKDDKQGQEDNKDKNADDKAPELDDKKADAKDDKKDGKAPKADDKKVDAKDDGKSNELEAWLSSDEGGSDALEDWLKGGEAIDAKPGDKKDAKKNGKNDDAPAPTSVEDMESEDSLKKWLSGDEDTALEEWLTAEPEPEQEQAEISFSAEGVEEMKGYVDGLVKDIKSGKTKVADVVSENAALKQTLSDEIHSREEIEKELENVKKSSVAVVKYIKAQQAKLKGKDTAKLQEMLDKQAMIKEKLEIKLHETEAEVRALRDEIGKKMEDMAPEAKEVKEKELQLLEMQKELAIKEKSLLQKEEALASGEGILMREINGDGGGVAGGIDPAALAEKQEEWDAEKQTILDEKTEAERKLEEALLERKQIEEQLKHSGMDEGAISKDLALKEKELANREKECMLQLEAAKDSNRALAMKDDEIRKLKETVVFKEEELLRREEDLMHREKVLEAENRKVTEAKKGIGTMEQQEAQKMLEDLKHKVAEKERELKVKEKYMASKEEDLKLREQGVIEDEIEAREEERKVEWTIEKIKTGVTRLDDLMLGGIPFGTNVAIYGPPFVGKETLMNVFVAEGLKKGIPAVWLITDKSPAEVREEMGFVISGYEEYEKMDLVRYIDTYSISMGEEPDDPYTTYVSDISETKEILKAVDTVCKELKQKHKYYRLVFRSVSTLVAYLGATEAFKFLQPFTGRRKRDKAVSMFAIEKGMHKDEEIQSISHTMDGNIDFKTEQLKTYLAVLGIGDVQSRSYVEYSHSKQSINIGSFSLDHIR